MKNRGYKKVIQTILISGMAYVINYGINLVLTPFITESIGTEAYGFVSLAKNFAQYATIITTALNSFAARYIAMAYHNSDMKLANKYYSSVFYGDLFIGTLIFAVSLGIIGALEYILNISAELLLDVKVLFLLIFVNFWITTVFTVFSCAAIVKNKLNVTGVFKAVSYIAEAAVLLVIFRYFSPNVYYVGLGLIAATATVAFSDRWIAHKFTPELHINRKAFSLNAVKELVGNGIWTSLNSVGNLLNSGLDLIVCNLMLDALAMGQLSIVKTIDTIFHSLYAIVAQAFQPMFLKSYADGDKRKLLRELRVSMKISGWVANLAFAGFYALGMAYYKLWIPNQDVELIYRLTVITILASVASGTMTPLYYIYTLTVRKVIPCMVTIVGGVLNVCGMYLLIIYTDMGIYAVVWTTTIIMMFINFVTNPIYMTRCLGLPWHTFYPNILRNVVSCFLMVVVFKVLCGFCYPSTWLGLIISILVCVLAGTMIHIIIVIDKEDRKFLQSRMGMNRR